jgi:3-hydroxyisobutyrate dehydrogenase-like beta-hydroxyacid dehydrogenase
MTTIGILSPGAMGSALGRAWQAGGARVVTTVSGRSARTQALARGLELLPGLGDVVEASDIVISVGPPALALTMASAIAASSMERDHAPVVADLNAVAPSTMQLVAAALRPAGCPVLDGAISGGPPDPAGSTTLYLSGPDAHLLAGLDAPGLTRVVVGPELGSASAVKMCTASMYKGLTGLLLQALATAQFHNVTAIVLDDLRGEFGALIDGAAARLASAAAKSDRFPGEMREIALTQSAAGLRPELFEAMAQVFELAHRSQLGTHSPEQAAGSSDLDAVLAELRSAR